MFHPVTTYLTGSEVLVNEMIQACVLSGNGKATGHNVTFGMRMELGFKEVGSIAALYGLYIQGHLIRLIGRTICLTMYRGEYRKAHGRLHCVSLECKIVPIVFGNRIVWISFGSRQSGFEPCSSIVTVRVDVKQPMICPISIVRESRKHRLNTRANRITNKMC